MFIIVELAVYIFAERYIVSRKNLRKYANKIDIDLNNFSNIHVHYCKRNYRYISPSNY